VLLVRKKCFVMFVASLVLLLLGPVQAEMSCEDMPCCSGESIASSQSTQVQPVCEACQPETCACSIQESAPEKQAKKSSLTFRFETEIQSAEAEPMLTEIQSSLSDEDETFDPADAFHPNDEHVSFSAFPNPPPSFF
jgi:hypothetical protein